MTEDSGRSHLCPNCGALTVFPDTSTPTAAPSDECGLLLALGIILSRPISDANRQHFAAQCFDAADRIVPGVSAIASSVLQGGD